MRLCCDGMDSGRTEVLGSANTQVMGAAAAAAAAAAAMSLIRLTLPILLLRPGTCDGISVGWGEVRSGCGGGEGRAHFVCESH